jgi:hypothetical protein
VTNDSGFKSEDGSGSAEHGPASTEYADQKKQRALADQAKDRLGQLKQKAGPLAEQAKGKASELADKAAPVAAQAKDKASGAAGKAGDLATTGVTAAAGGLDKVTGGRWHDKIAAVSGKLSQVLHSDDATKNRETPVTPSAPPTSSLADDTVPTDVPLTAPPTSLLDADDSVTPGEAAPPTSALDADDSVTPEQPPHAPPSGPTPMVP